MIIQRINKLNKFGCFQTYQWDDTQLCDFKKVNVLYGNNGSGKTTLSNLFYFLSKYCKEKKELSKEYFLPETEIEFQTETGKLIVKSDSENNESIYIFNSKFISDHVYNGGVANVDAFSADVKLTNDSITAIDKRLEWLSSQKKKLDDWEIELDTKIDSIWNPYREEFLQKILKRSNLTNKPDRLTATPVVPTLPTLSELYEKYVKKTKEVQVKQALEAIKEKAKLFSLINIDFEPLKNLLGKEINNETRKKVQEKINALEISYQKYTEDKKEEKTIILNKWYSEGKKLLEVSSENEKSCPLCNTDLNSSIDNIIGDYSAFFSKEIILLFKSIENIEAHIKSIQEKFISENKQILNDLKILSGASGLIFEFPEYIDTSNLVIQLDALSEQLKNKKTSPNLAIIITEADISECAIFNAYFTDITSKITTLADAELLKLGEATEESIIGEIKNKIREVVITNFNSTTNCILSPSKKSNNEIALKIQKIKKEAFEKIQREEVLRLSELTKLDAESRFVNLYLELLGIDVFTIKREKDKSIDNILISYKETGTLKQSLKHSLSEGEKTALAFAYFISKIRVEQLEGKETGFSNCSVVIDDPISSLDENRLFQTANLIDSFFLYNKSALNLYPIQLFVLSHNLTFLKFFFNAVSINKPLKEEITDYYISPNGNGIVKIPNGLQNFTNTYLIKLKDIIDFFHKRGAGYEEVRKHLPNSIRIAIETFLSFKLALVKDDRDMMPGLKYLIEKTITELNDSGEFNMTGYNGEKLNTEVIIKKLNALKQISDFESHGNIGKLESVTFISEQELRKFCVQTLQVIKYLDSLHLRRVSSLA